jgi:hypothetical protein
LPILDEKNNNWMHIATSLRYGKPKDDVMTLKSRPESNPTHSLSIQDSSSQTIPSIMRAKSIIQIIACTVGSEVISHHFYSKDSGDHTFNGGNVMVAIFFYRRDTSV